jgi:hypothetical protein
VLHTEPSLSKTNKYGQKIQPEIKWYDKDWTYRHVNMIIAICSYLSRPAEIIEIHPGYRKNTYGDIVNSVVQLLESYYEAFHLYPLILLENRTEQFISRGTDIKEFWEYTLEKYPELEQNFGIVIDVQQLQV